MKLCWATDIHLNFLTLEERKKYYQSLIDTGCDSIVISGDIAEANSVGSLLVEMSEYVQMPINFVLGNHDYYYGSVDDVRNEITNLSHKSNYLEYLPYHIQELTSKIYLIGQDNWADGRYGDFNNSRVTLGDHVVIKDFKFPNVKNRQELLLKMQQLAKVDADKLKSTLNILSNPPELPTTIIIASHIPPFRESCLYQGKISNDDYLPFFSSQIFGNVLEIFAKDNPDINLLILCGHTHGRAEYSPLPNLTVLTGHSDYYAPGIEKIIECSEEGVTYNG